MDLLTLTLELSLELEDAESDELEDFEEDDSEEVEEPESQPQLPELQAWARWPARASPAITASPKIP